MRIPSVSRSVHLLLQYVPYIFFVLLTASVITLSVRVFRSYETVQKERASAVQRNLELSVKIVNLTSEINKLTSDDQFIRNNLLEEELGNIKNTYGKSVTLYEQILKLRDDGGKVQPLEVKFAEVLSLLSNRNWSSASSTLTSIEEGIAKARLDMMPKEPTGIPAVVSNTAPTSEYSRQSVTTDAGQFVVDIIAGDLSTTRVIVDSASDSDCKNDCPVMPLANYVSRNGGYAGINGSYFCPDTYPTCADKKNSFDTLLMNKNKYYINSDNNVYSTVPAVIFLGSSVRFVGRSLDWGRDTGNDGVLANQPLLVSGGNTMFGGDDDPKKSGQGLRAFVTNKGNTVYIGVVHNASVAQAAVVLKSLGMDNALNLDSGGSTALWFNGYKFGPGRNIPNAIIFVRR